MQQRREAHDSLDDFPTPPWATRALCEALYYSPTPWTMTAREPAANRGHMVRPLLEYFDCVDASDIHDYGAGFPVRDYLFGPLPPMVDWTITNPPFRLAEQFIDRARETSREGVAVIVRTAYLESVSRYNTLFKVTPPSLILQFAERVVMHKAVSRPRAPPRPPIAGWSGSTATTPQSSTGSPLAANGWSGTAIIPRCPHDPPLPQRMLWHRGGHSSVSFAWVGTRCLFRD